MNAHEIAQYLADQEFCSDKDAAGIAAEILRRLDFSPIWDQVDTLFEVVVESKP